MNTTRLEKYIYDQQPYSGAFVARRPEADVATADLPELFDFQQINTAAKQELGITDPQPWKIVGFFSQLIDGYDDTELVRYDQLAFEAARVQPGFGYYEAGERDPDNLWAVSWCMFTEPGATQVVARDANHRAATRHTSAYQQWRIEKYLAHHATGTVALERLNPPS